MSQALTKPITFDEFIAWYPEDSEVRYELHDGVIVEIPKPRGKHSRVAGFAIDGLNDAIKLLNKRGIWFIPRESIVKTSEGKSGYEPDIIVLDEEALVHETRWESQLNLPSMNHYKTACHQIGGLLGSTNIFRLVLPYRL